ncbi:MAG: hypothetical protein HWE22_11770 [Flavobacteriales bacterium]|nr:hypothetical protein [Flavobacteriales bacterium]
MSKTYLFFLLLTLLFTCLFSPSYAQEVDTVEINGESFFVYPFKVKARSHGLMRIGGKNSLNSITYEIYQELVAERNEEVASKKEFKEMKRQMKKFERKMGKEFSNEEEFKYLNSNKLKKAIRNNPYPLMQQRFSADNDLTPMLDPIPDGKYIQYYMPFCMMNKKGECELVSDQIAGYFTIKNNLLEGEACWIDLQGDTLKHGLFVNGIKEGEWKFERRKLDYDLSKEEVNNYIERGYPTLDTLIEYVSYKNGVQHGPYRKFLNSEYPIDEGYFEDGVPSGTWIERKIVFTGFGDRRKRNRNNELITLKKTYEQNDSLVVNTRWIRKGLANTYRADNDQFDFYPKYDLPNPPRALYEIAFEKEEENLELEEELQGAQYDMDYYEEDYFDEMEFEELMNGGEFGYDDYYARAYDKNEEKLKGRGVLLDSIGGRPKYANMYEVRYDNGQLAYRYSFENGQLIDEDTIFWDNGIAHDVITEVPDSNQYLRSIYDYTGKLYLQLAYDSLGDFIRIQEEFQEEEKFVIEGYEVTGGQSGNFYFYDKYDTLGKDGMVDSTLLFQSWFVDDSTKMYSAMYYPSEKRFSSKGYSSLGNMMMKEDKSYADNFESWTGKRYTYLGDLELEKTSSASFLEYYEPDSIPIQHVRSDQTFNVASEYKLIKAGKPYTGPVNLKFGEKKFKMGKEELNMSLPVANDISEKLRKDLDQFRETGKTKYPIMLGFLDPTELDQDFSTYIFYSFFAGPLDGIFEMNSYGEYSYSDYSEVKKGKDAPARLSRLEGYMIDGKPNGTWVSYDQFGKKMTEANFLKGELNGEAKWYKYAKPMEDDGYSYAQYDYENPLRDSFPKKKVHYLVDVTNYENGKIHGKQTTYSWYGEMTSESYYEDGMLHGKSIERNKIATTEASYKYGDPDGYIRTYLTLTPGDSILLYNLNFQDGLLQGESKSFHTNGKLAKRGFFLDGMPIEDYEAYDSLGVKYHYVKFKYSYPIEEKIWEENELSVRYLFNWEDSIYFEPRDITTSQSLESIISKLGLGGDYFERPYYGRPSLVNKNGINYHMTKYYPNDTISRDGDLSNGRKVGCWKYYSYNGELLYEVDYQDSIIAINDSVRFKSKGVLTDFDREGNLLYQSYVIEMSSKYDCSHSDHYEIRQLYTKWEADDSLGRMNGYVQNFYDNGTLQSEGNMKNGLPDGVWKYYDPFGKLNQYGVYVLGKRNARWLSGDLSKTKYLGDICLNPNLPDLEEEMKYRENLLDIKITNYKMGKALNSQYYDINMNRFIDDEEESVDEMEEE